MSWGSNLEHRYTWESILHFNCLKFIPTHTSQFTIAWISSCVTIHLIHHFDTKLYFRFGNFLPNPLCSTHVMLVTILAAWTRLHFWSDIWISRVIWVERRAVLRPSSVPLILSVQESPRLPFPGVWRLASVVFFLTNMDKTGELGLIIDNNVPLVLRM